MEKLRNLLFYILAISLIGCLSYADDDSSSPYVEGYSQEISDLIDEGEEEADWSPDDYPNTVYEDEDSQTSQEEEP